MARGDLRYRPPSPSSSSKRAAALSSPRAPTAAASEATGTGAGGTRLGPRRRAETAARAPTAAPVRSPICSVAQPALPSMQFPCPAAQIHP
jgi:hypothetical protein